MNTIIELEDNGQDFLEIITDHVGVIIELRPFNTGAFLGGLIPIGQEEMMAPGELLPIHHPPIFNFGFLKHKIKSVKKVEIQVIETMKVFKFYSGEDYYGFSGKTEKEAKQHLFEDVGEMQIDLVEEIPESEWDDEIISIWEDNNQDTEPFKISIREAMSTNDCLMLFTNDMSSIL